MTIGAPNAFAWSGIAAAPGCRATLPAVAGGKQHNSPFVHRLDDLPRQRMVGVRSILRIAGLLIDSPTTAQNLRRTRGTVFFDCPLNAGDGVRHAGAVGRAVRYSDVVERRFRCHAERV